MTRRMILRHALHGIEVANTPWLQHSTTTIAQSRDMRQDAPRVKRRLAPDTPGGSGPTDPEPKHIRRLHGTFKRCIEGTKATCKASTSKLKGEQPRSGHCAPQSTAARVTANALKFSLNSCCPLPQEPSCCTPAPANLRCGSSFARIAL